MTTSGTPVGGPRPGPSSDLDYLALEAAYAVALAAAIALARRRDPHGDAAIPRGELPVLALATFALADVVAKEKISTWLRDPFVEESADHRPLRPRGSGLRRAVGELLTCTRCMGTWSALGLIGLRGASPAAGRTVTSVLALTGANDVMQAAFRLLAERADREAAAAEAARRALAVHP